MTTFSKRYSVFASAGYYSVLKVYPLGSCGAKPTAAGVDDGEVPPVPIPNTEVKLTCAEDSCLETDCENR